MKYDLPPFAVLIDADNVRLDTISPILEEITRHSRVTVRRIYGDFTSQNLAAWKGKLAEHAIHPIQQYRNTTGKNASDSALIIDAMDLLHSRRFEGFCLVSSDSDFTRLATRIREDGLVVFGFGEKKAPKAFVNACDRYIYVENLLEAPQPEQTPEARNEPASESCEKEVGKIASSGDTLPEPEGEKPLAFRPPAMAVKILLRAYTNVADEQGWAMLGQMSTYIHANYPDFDPRTHGCAKFIDLVQKTVAFELVQRAYKNGQSYFCRPLRAACAPLSGAEKTKQYMASLEQAVQAATATNGWAPIGMIGQKLKGLGCSVKESGYATLTEALTAAGRFEMTGSGAARYFRVKGQPNR
ncbi:NYN domain-containing protein [Propionivibrio limicola]|uniref:NYN domain-containing protein n=1 Tax=Propionivibrio limicola TaxID=167645 RepID=UPI001292356F|nr:NYN domain-containing protein [Propionivibrio limicola]